MISFIIPTLNEEKCIGETLECLTRYSGTHEIIVADGGSSDRTVEIAKRYTPHIVVHTGLPHTIAAGKNAGAATARGELLLFIDADVQIPNADAFFAPLLALFEKRPRVVALTVGLRVLPELATVPDKIIFGIVNFHV